MIFATATAAILNMKTFGNGLMSRLDHISEEEKDETYAFQERQRPQERPRQERYDPREQTASMASYPSQQYRSSDPRQHQYQADPRQQGQRPEYRYDYRQQDIRR